MALDFKRALVTGGAGFIGSHLTEALVSEGCRVTVLDNLSSGHRANLDGVKDAIDFRQGDICDSKAVDAACRGCEAVFHLAAVVSVPQTVKQPIESTRVNDLGTLQVFEAARQNGVGRIVFASSSAVYGDDPQLPKKEEMPPNPLSPYAVQKIGGEYFARIYFQLHGIRTVSLRFFNVFGPRQDPSSPYSGVISIFMTRAVAGAPATITGDGSQSRDFVYVADVVRASLLAATTPAAAGETINVGSGRSVEINGLWQQICRIHGQQIPARYTDPRPGDIHASLAGIGKAQSMLGFSPRLSFAQGLERTFDWYRQSQQEQPR
jgi:UDP-glucose 4-epimerase